LKHTAPSLESYSLCPRHLPGLEPFEEDATMGGKERCENEGFNRYELDEDIKRGARSVLKRVSNGVTNNSCLVRVKTFWAKGPGML
jgi:hypothetical protein